MTDSTLQPTLTHKPHDVARDVYENAVRGDIPIDSAIEVLTRHSMATSGEGSRYRQLSAWIAKLEEMQR